MRHRLGKGGMLRIWGSSAWPVYVVHWQGGKKWKRELGWSQMVNDLLDSAQNCRCNCKSRAINSKTKKYNDFFLILDHLHENIGILGSEEYVVFLERKKKVSSDEMFGR